MRGVCCGACRPTDASKWHQDSSKIHVTWEWTGRPDGFLLGVMKKDSKISCADSYTTLNRKN